MIYAGRGARRPRARRARRGPLPPGHLPRARCGRRSSSTSRRTSSWCACRRRSPTPPSWPTGSRPSADRRRRSSSCAGRCTCTTATSSATAPTTGCTSSRRSTAAGRTPRRCASTPRPSVAGTAGTSARPAAAAAGSCTRPGRPETIELLDQRRPAAGDRLHLQPQPVRGGRPDLPRRRPAPDRRRRARPHPGDRRRPPRRSRRRRPRRARPRPVPRPAGGRHRRPPRRHGPGVQGGRRGLLRRGPHQGRLRHRDAGRRRQHAGPHGRHREADQVHRRPPRDADAGGVHPADRAGRSAGHRRRGPRRRAVEPVRALRAGGRPGVEPHVPPPLGVPPDVQHGRQPRRHVLRASRPTTCSTCRSPSTSPTATSCASRPGWSGSGPTWPTAREAAESPYGDIWDYRRSLDEIRSRRRGRDDLVSIGLARLRPGEVVHASKGRYRGSGRRRRQRPPQGRHAADDRDRPRRPAPAHGRRLPGRAPPPRHGATADRVTTRTATSTAGRSPGRCRARRCGRPTGGRGGVRSSDGAHAVESDPDLRQRMRAAGQTERLERELVDLSSRVDGHGQSLARQFDHVLDVLDRRGYVDADAWALTARGDALRRVFHEADLLVAECLLGGLFDGVDAATLAGLLSVFVHEHRSPEPPPAPWFPSTGGSRSLAPHPRRQRGPRRRRAIDGPARAPAARPRVRRRCPRLGRRRGPGRGRRATRS